MQAGKVERKDVMMLTAVAGLHAVGIPKSLLALQLRYWFRPGGASALAICRIFLFGYLYLHVFHGVLGNGIADTTNYYQSINLAAYHPKSLVFLLFPLKPPPSWVIETLIPIAAVSTLCALAGLLTRLSMLVSVVSLTFLTAFIYSWEPLWSHSFNSGLLAGIAIMFSRAGDTLSIDSLAMRLICKRQITTSEMVYWWPIILGQFGVAAVYFGGFYAKWSTPGFTYNLDWALSDNLRNSVALPWLIWGRPFPPQVELLINSPFLWKTAALGHLATQGLPILAIFSLKHPWVRLTEGAIFSIGVVLLGVVMGIWNLPWILLAAFFVDWEFFLQKLRLPVRHTHDSTVLPKRYPAIQGYALFFVATNLVIIGTRLDDYGWNRAYPFSSMTFYSNVAASPPYSQHRHYPFTYAELVFEYPDGHQRKWFCHPAINSLYLAAFKNANVEHKLEQQIGSIKSVEQRLELLHSNEIVDCSGSVDAKHFRAIDLYASILDIPPFPERAQFVVGHRALVGRYERDSNRFIAAAAELQSDDGLLAVNVRSEGLDVDHYAILLSNDPWKHYKVGPLLQVPGQWANQSFKVDQDYYRTLASGWYPIVVRAFEKSGRSYDFFGGVLYR